MKVPTDALVAGWPSRYYALTLLVTLCFSNAFAAKLNQQRD
jgi:hypothetical protein